MISRTVPRRFVAKNGQYLHRCRKARKLSCPTAGSRITLPLKCVSGWITGLSYRAPTAVTRAPRLLPGAHRQRWRDAAEGVGRFVYPALRQLLHQRPQAYLRILGARRSRRGGSWTFPTLKGASARGAGERGVRSGRRTLATGSATPTNQKIMRVRLLWNAGRPAQNHAFRLM